MKYAENVIQAFLMYDQVKDIATATGKSVRTVYNLKKDAEFQKVLAERRTEYVKTSVSKMQCAMNKVTDQLLKIIDDPETPTPTKVSAINTFFNQCKDWTTVADIMERLKRIEETQGKY